MKGRSADSAAGESVKGETGGGALRSTELNHGIVLEVELATGKVMGRQQQSLVAIDPEAIKDEQQRQQILEQFSVSLHLTPDKFQKDLELYRGNLDKFDQLLIAVADTLEADRKKRKDKQTLAESKKLLATEDSISDSSPS